MLFRFQPGVKYPHKDTNQALQHDREMIRKNMADALERF